MSVAVIIAASGSGLRLGGDIPKQFQMLGTKPILAHTISAFKQTYVNEIIIAAPEDYVQYTQEIAPGCTVVAGGENRATSVLKALKQLPATTEIVLIHDGVRPFVTPEVIKAVTKKAKTHKAAIAGIPLTDTIKEVDKAGRVTATPNRELIWRIQTPQGFEYPLIMEAYAQGESDGVLPYVTDDSTLVERLGTPVHMVNGHPSNIKITTQEDLLLGSLLSKSSGQRET
ncbi:MAG: 2-C-methyl-D-erythritol 4-phosphate cytidylyltransferase [Defluviitaleaceae bacterium]|nr:2-C-methyl-D-erythritol 4-phosphate cytidylyltransferase [Defluviitaleaceae bacterium]